MDYIQRLAKGFKDEAERQTAQFEMEKHIMPFLASGTVDNLCLVYQLYPRKKRIVSILWQQYNKAVEVKVYKRIQAISSTPQHLTWITITKEEFENRDAYLKFWLYYEYTYKAFGIIEFEYRWYQSSNIYATKPKNPNWTINIAGKRFTKFQMWGKKNKETEIKQTLHHILSMYKRNKLKFKKNGDVRW